MAGQCPERREVLKAVAAALAASQFPGLVRWTYGQHQHADTPVEVRAAEYKPQFFSPEDYKLVERLTEIIIPADDTPGAREAGVSEFIDFMVWSDPTLQKPFRDGIAWMNRRAGTLQDGAFLSLDRARQDAILTELAYKDHFVDGTEEGRAFFHLVREYTLMGYYTSRVGMQQLDWPGLRFYSEPPGCPHVGNPEHLHLDQGA